MTGEVSRRTTTYTVAKGDNLYSIATKQGVAKADVAGWVAKVVAENGIADANLIYPDQKLKLPSLEASSFQEASPRRGPTLGPQTGSPPPIDPEKAADAAALLGKNLGRPSPPQELDLSSVGNNKVTVVSESWWRGDVNPDPSKQTLQSAIGATYAAANWSEAKAIEGNNVGYSVVRSNATPCEVQLAEDKTIFVSEADGGRLKAQLRTGAKPDFYEIGKEISLRDSIRWTVQVDPDASQRGTQESAGKRIAMPQTQLTNTDKQRSWYEFYDKQYKSVDAGVESNRTAAKWANPLFGFSETHTSAMPVAVKLSAEKTVFMSAGDAESLKDRVTSGLHARLYASDLQTAKTLAAFREVDREVQQRLDALQLTTDY